MDARDREDVDPDALMKTTTSPNPYRDSDKNIDISMNQDISGHAYTHPIRQYPVLPCVMRHYPEPNPDIALNPPETV